MKKLGNWQNVNGCVLNVNSKTKKWQRVSFLLNSVLIWISIFCVMFSFDFSIKVAWKFQLSVKNFEVLHYCNTFSDTKILQYWLWLLTERLVKLWMQINFITIFFFLHTWFPAIFLKVIIRKLSLKWLRNVDRVTNEPLLFIY